MPGNRLSAAMQGGVLSSGDARQSIPKRFPACSVLEGSLILLTKTIYSCIFIPFKIMSKVWQERFHRPGAVQGSEADS
jgi:hypothetical protein